MYCCEYIYSAILKFLLWEYINISNIFILLYQIILLQIKTMENFSSIEKEKKHCKQKF